ncbi:hypothetical protein IE53DRAFT_384305 [Violaceomyces palustris]|uniref:Uncharacterized protein n=1 Tax=Violaceomyces palustris TaxID=1673888 RepID=A0ACD0P5D3_9BASI|nr:hypothetical protein IE53DRAFT_384305 [Violaceomyces palustris]
MCVMVVSFFHLLLLLFLLSTFNDSSLPLASTLGPPWSTFPIPQHVLFPLFRTSLNASSGSERLSGSYMYRRGCACVCVCVVVARDPVGLGHRVGRS